MSAAKGGNEDDAGWDTAKLMGLEPGEDPPQPPPEKGKGVEDDPMLWGVPGHMTAAEVDTYCRFRDEVEARGGDFRDTVYCFGDEEGEVWAIARWCRARKFVYDDIVTMVEEATQVRAEAKQQDFYPDPVHALGVDASYYFAQFPQLYYGVSKHGHPVFISKPGILNVDGAECLTTLDGIIKFHWFIMMHDYANRLRKQKAEDPNFKRFECVCVLDLNKLTTSQLSRRALAIIKEQSAIDSVCFPETMNKMLIINAPTFFSASWRLIRGWLDPRTASKIEVISSAATAQQRLLELVDSDQLPSDYGGAGPHTDEIMHESFAGKADRLATKMVYLRGHGSELVEIPDGESLQVEVFTRSLSGAKFTLWDADSTTHHSIKAIVEGVEAKHTGTGEPTEKSTSLVLNEAHIDGPKTIKVKVDSHASRFSTHNYLLVYSFFKKSSM